VYDRVYAWKDYAAEAVRIRQLVRRYGPTDAHALLDVACGTGEHLRFLGRWYRVTGLDSSSAMLSFARRKLPGARFVLGRMQSFRLPERFDVITCLFSAIGYVRSEADLRRTLRNFEEHLRPGGVVLLEPWLTRSNYREGSYHLGTYGSKGFPIARMNRSVRRGNRSIMDMHYLVGTKTGVRHWVERHDMALFDDVTLRRGFRSAGPRVRRIASRFSTQRGLYVGVKPTAVADRALRM
jgi:SAM-dependent methyltransferase